LLPAATMPGAVARRTTTFCPAVPAVFSVHSVKERLSWDAVLVPFTGVPIAVPPVTLLETWPRTSARRRTLLREACPDVVHIEDSDASGVPYSASTPLHCA
jgi:hypothetical protein